MRVSETVAGSGAVRSSRVVAERGVSYVVLREGSCWRVEYVRVFKESGRLGKISEARNCGFVFWDRVLIGILC